MTAEGPELSGLAYAAARDCVDGGETTGDPGLSGSAGPLWVAEVVAAVGAGNCRGSSTLPSSHPALLLASGNSVSAAILLLLGRCVDGGDTPEGPGLAGLGAEAEAGGYSVDEGEKAEVPGLSEVA